MEVERIQHSELIEIFGLSVPIEAVHLFQEWKGTTDELRAELHKIAASTPKPAPSSELVDRLTNAIWKQLSPHDWANPTKVEFTATFDDLHQAARAALEATSVSGEDVAGDVVKRVAEAIQNVSGGLNYDYADFCRDAAEAAIAAYRAAIASTGSEMRLPINAGICAYDRDECTVTIACVNEADVLALVKSIPARNRITLRHQGGGQI